jgi:aminotransferase
MKVSERISKRERELPGARIEELAKKGREPGFISLGPGEPDFPTPEPIVAYAKKLIAKCSHYTSAGGTEEFRKAAAAKLKKENGIECGPENIVATTGSTEGIFLSLACTMDPGEHVIVPDPGFLSYIPSIELLGGHPVSLELREEDGWNVDIDRLSSTIDRERTRAVIINTPSNPTGTVFSKKRLEEIADVAVENDLLIISDEAYEKFVYDDAVHVSIGSLNGISDRVITLQTFSKTFAMPGWRLGYVCAPAKIAEAIAKVHIYTSLNAPALSQAAGAFALAKLDRKYVERMREEYDKRRRLMAARLNEMGLPTAEPKGAFYTFSNVKELSSSSNHFVDVLLKKAKVAVIPGSEFGKFGEGYVRCSYATSMKQIEEALDRMEEALRHRWV